MTATLTIKTPEGTTSNTFLSYRAAAKEAARYCESFGAGQYASEPSMWRVSKQHPRVAFGSRNNAFFVELTYGQRP